MTNKISSCLKVACLLVIGILFGCAQRESILLIDGSSELLEEPYPINYPSSSPKPNRVLSVITDQEILILREWTEKDYAVYKVRSNDGTEGFIISGPKVHKKG